uniref:Ig-like domain-containing protein n=1 Tax=Moschus moschiferus TaxID=68415 RepID=A0A8C6FIT0_MOSMO
MLLNWTSGDSVTQTEGIVTLPKEASLTLNCTYQSSYSVFLFWYVQYQNKELKLLLKSSSGNQKVTSRGFEASFVRSDSSFHLQKRAVQASDSAVYYCALSDTVRECCRGAERKPRVRMGLCCGQPWEGLLFLSSVFYASCVVVYLLSHV